MRVLRDPEAGTRPRLLVVGAFPPAGSSVVGGIVTTCATLMKSDFPQQFSLILLDSTQRSNPPPGFLVRLAYVVVRFLRFAKSLLCDRPDAVLLFTAVGSSLLEKSLMGWLARLGAIPVFMFPRGAGLIETVRNSRFQRAWIVPAMRGATHLLCQGPAWQRFATDVLGFERSRTEIIHNWSATAELLRIGEQRPAACTAERLRILFLGWVEREKGVFELLEACRQLSDRYRFTVTVAGRGHAENEARRFVESHGLEPHVAFVGWVHGQPKLDLLESTDILVLPSWAEGFPNAIIEAMAAKVAVIVTAVGNVPDVLRDREEALLIPAKDVCALANALEEVLVDEAFRLQLAERGHTFARENFSTDQGVARLASVIKEAIHEGKETR